MVAEKSKDASKPEKPESKLSRPEDLLTEYMNFTAAITDELTSDRLKLFKGESKYRYETLGL